MNQSDWPSDGDLRQMIRESVEHQRTWRLVGGLSERLIKERKANRFAGPSSPEQNERIHSLEQRIVKQKAMLAHLEECRAFEAETERMLVKALTWISQNYAGDTTARQALAEFDKRKGPRPVDNAQ